MVDLSTTYLGLKLKNPLIVGSCGLTSNVANVIELAKKGAGAIVLKSIFEEQIKFESDEFLNSDNPEMKSWQDTFDSIINQNETYHDEAYEYLTSYAKEHSLNQYLKLIEDSKKAVDVPIIASIHCNTSTGWQYFAKRIQSAGADAIVLNVYLLPSDFEKSGADNEKVYFEIISEVQKYITIPFSLKIGPYFSSLSQTALKLSQTGISGLVLFSRAYSPDIDINNLEMSTSNVYSNPKEYTNALRWVAILSGKLDCDISASTGVHDAEAAIKFLLAGANVFQIVSVLYKQQFDAIPKILDGIKEWMEKHEFKTIDEFRGKLSQKNVKNPAAYERVQFIRLYSSIV